MNFILKKQGFLSGLCIKMGYAHHEHTPIKFQFCVIYPQTSSAISLTSLSFAHCSSSVSLLPISQEANPPWHP